ncbi:uncharacterized protein LOC127257446 [Andrographis paniculata]|uniref:uncharacterized protein LOC127257446 n=1 Tax=Andrographis paniculata TaxID=175694 RepID=UPI0021E94F5F|nr:uncharacterized protein LOC127257446 [Andrographis paniculata]
MANLRTDSPLSRRIATSFLQFLDSVEPSAGVDSEALEVAKECLAEVFKVDRSSIGSQSNCESLVDMFTSREAISSGNEGGLDAPSSSSGKNPQVMEGKDRKRELHLPGEDELFGNFFGGLERIHYFRRMPDGSDDQTQLDRASSLFHKAVEEMQMSGCQTFDPKTLAENFKSQGNKAMQSKHYLEAIELYTFAIALSEHNAVYYCNRAAAYTQIHQYDEAIKDCLKSIEINPNYSKAYSRLGFAYYAQGRYRDAIDKGFIKALQLDPNNASVKENIQVAEQKLREEQQREATGQSSTSTSHGQFNHQFGGGTFAAPPPLNTLPFNINALSPDISSFLANMSGNAFHGQQPFQNGSGEPNEPSDPGGSPFGANINLNVNDLPQELSGAFRSMMGMFSGGAAPNPEDGEDRRPDSSSS